MNRLAQIRNQFLDFLLPQTCIGCGQEVPDQLLCPDCLEIMGTVRSPFCRRCGRPLKKGMTCQYCKNRSLVDRGRSWLIFVPPGDRVIHHFKYRKKTRLAALLGQGMATLIRSDPLLKKCQVIVPVPLFWWKRWRRGYNQARLLAEVIGQELAIEVKDILQRTRNTRTQTKLGDEARMENVRNAFRIKDNTVDNRIVLLVDDVLTTGATINECARVLKEAGAHKVYSCVAAITPG